MYREPQKSQQEHIQSHIEISRDLQSDIEPCKKLEIYSHYFIHQFNQLNIIEWSCVMINIQINTFVAKIFPFSGADRVGHMTGTQVLFL